MCLYVSVLGGIFEQGCFPVLVKEFTHEQCSHRLEKYSKMKGCLEKYLKTKYALKSA